nr:helix-turn-helix domain-containing protein [Enterococcus sp. 3C7_DIV0644]
MPSSSVPNSNIAKHKVLRLLVQTQKRPHCLVYKSIVQDHGNRASILKIAMEYNVTRQSVYRIKENSMVNID